MRRRFAGSGIPHGAPRRRGLPFNPPDTSNQPNALDIVGAVNKFKSLPGVPIKAFSQVQPNVPDPHSDVDARDIRVIVEATKGFAYPFGGPCACPSTVLCNATECSTATQCAGPYGAGATCGKTCTTGPRVGALCNNDSHCGCCAGGSRAGYPCDADIDCPGDACTHGTCGPGFCRDRCGRCD